jgi:S1-C subfamily serine protease
MKTAFAAFALVALCIVGLFVWQPRAATTQTSHIGHPTVKILVGKKSHGSGVYIGGDGLILTAAHVVAEAKDGIVTVKTEGGNIIKNAEVLWTSKARDVALVRVPSTFGLSPAVLSCDMPKPGDTIQARGNPLSVEFFSSWGHVAGTMREMGPWLEGIPTDLTILPGMSGGPIFSNDGRVVGLAVGVLMAPAGISGMSFTGATLIVPGSTICPLLGR